MSWIWTRAPACLDSEYQSFPFRPGSGSWRLVYLIYSTALSHLADFVFINTTLQLSLEVGYQTFASAPSLM